MKKRQYIAIDLKSFYASVECVERGLDPLNTNLVVADLSRTEKTVCLAVTPTLKAYGISGRARLFEVIQAVQRVNGQRLYNYRRKTRDYKYQFTEKSHFDSELKSNPALELDYIVAPPRMAFYMAYSTRIYEIYLKYIAPEDIVVYSIDEVFMDVTDYLNTYKMTAKELAMTIIKDVLSETGITATAGIGTNLYLCKVAMDIVAKHLPADENGVRIAELDEMSYRRELWAHTPLTDFWRVGAGTVSRIEKYGIKTMGDIARCSLTPKGFCSIETLYKVFGKNAELLIDHAWGYEPCTVPEIQKYKPENNSLSSGQVLHIPYEYEKARIVMREMVDALSLDLVEKGLVTNQLVITVGYDIENLTNPTISARYRGEVVTDHYGRKVPKHSHGTINLSKYTASSRILDDKAVELFDRIVNKELLVRRLNVAACKLIPEDTVPSEPEAEQMNFFVDFEAEELKRKQEEKLELREKNIQKAMLNIKKKYGKNAVLRGTNLQEGATARDRNAQIGGHKA